MDARRIIRDVLVWHSHSVLADGTRGPPYPTRDNSRAFGNTGSMSYDAQTPLRSSALDLFAAPPDQTTFWSGAGISGDPPTQGSIGCALTDRALEQAFDRDVLLDKLRGAYTLWSATGPTPTGVRARRR